MSLYGAMRPDEESARGLFYCCLPRSPGLGWFAANPLVNRDVSCCDPEHLGRGLHPEHTGDVGRLPWSDRPHVNQTMAWERFEMDVQLLPVVCKWEEDV